MLCTLLSPFSSFLSKCLAHLPTSIFGKICSFSLNAWLFLIKGDGVSERWIFLPAPLLAFLLLFFFLLLGQLEKTEIYRSYLAPPLLFMCCPQPPILCPLATWPPLLAPHHPPGLWTTKWEKTGRQNHSWWPKCSPSPASSTIWWKTRFHSQSLAEKT